ncbi:unnamed protein product [Eruca vesicaria subsp. sativa]|uniref:Uncharacterized protein n=1 Tax=Eruca vesicaria subsp. sativa TaxID=29727 RepID=A0ABC8JVT7_ERUVS|nr:unnamed protein product [Eruca vesicaria subsp. sativa]
MEPKSTSSGVLRRKPPSFRFYPYTSGSSFVKEGMKEEVVRLGVEFSVSVAELMFLSCDDIRTMLFTLLKLWKYVLPESSPVVGRLFLVILYIYSKDIKPKNNGVLYQNGEEGKSPQRNLIKTTLNDFVCGIIVLLRLVVSVLRVKDNCSFHDRLLSSAIAKYKQELKNLEDKLRPAKDVSEANGFARETIKSNIFQFWKSLFEAHMEITRETENRMRRELFRGIDGETWDVEIMSLPLLHPPYILGRDFIKQELKDEVVRRGVELSLYVAQSMFLLCDDIRSMLLFCFKLWRDAKRCVYPNSLVLERVVRVIHYVYFRYIEPKNGVYRNGGLSVHMRLAITTWENFKSVIISMNLLVLGFRQERRCACGPNFLSSMSSLEEQLKKVEEKLRCGKVVSEANGFLKEVIEPSFFGLWKSLFDTEANNVEATQTLRVIRYRILHDLFLPLHNEVAPPL